MKKILFIFSLFLTNQAFVQAQPYLDTTSHWTEIYSRNIQMIPDLDYGTGVTDYTIVGDTNINSFNYYKLWKDYVSDMYNPNGYDSLGNPIFDYVHQETHTLYGYLRESGKKWYFKYTPTSNELLLYDFDMQTDSLVGNYGTYLGGDCAMSAPIISGIGHFCLGNSPRLSFGIFADGSYQVSNNILEGIGAQASLFGKICNDLEPESDFSMTFTQGGNSVNWNTSCWGVAIDKGDISKISFYPNPANESIFISSPKKIESLEIYNMQGAKVKTLSPNQHTLTLALTDLLPGVYLLMLNGEQVQKFVKE